MFIYLGPCLALGAALVSLGTAIIYFEDVLTCGVLYTYIGGSVYLREIVFFQLGRCSSVEDVITCQRYTRPPSGGGGSHTEGLCSSVTVRIHLLWTVIKYLELHQYIGG